MRGLYRMQGDLVCLLLLDDWVLAGRLIRCVGVSGGALQAVGYLVESGGR